MMNNKNKILFIALVVTFLFVCIVGDMLSNKMIEVVESKRLNILASSSMKPLENKIYKKGYEINFTYMGDIDIVDELNTNAKSYDGVWISNSMWLYMLENQYLTSNSKSIAISPIVLGIRKSKAKSLNLIGKELTNDDIVTLVKNKKIKYVMPSVTSTNTGATAYIGFLNSLAGNSEVLTETMLDNTKLVTELKNLFSGTLRVSGDEEYLKEMFINNDDYEAIITDEASLIDINKKLLDEDKEELYLFYPKDGLSINDMTLAFISNDKSKENDFINFQNFLLSESGQELLEENGYRTWYGGVSSKTNPKVFNPEWGIDTEKYLNVTNFPSKKVITKAINVYIESLRKPTHAVFCLDYSGSMSGEGIQELRDSMNYILNSEEASKDRLQFSKGDKITVITFSTKVTNIWKALEGTNTTDLIDNINKYSVGGSTALYDAVQKGLEILNKETDDYTTTIIAMTDGYINEGSFNTLEKYYKTLNKEIPVYSITFGDASEKQLDKIAKLTNAKIFDGKEDLLKAFKEVRSYN